jgi:3-oxoacyl-(acyl-carrier-protein) synthase
VSNTVYITGAGIISAIGIGVEETEQSLRNGISGVGEMQLLQSEHKELPCGEVKLSNAELKRRLHIADEEVDNRTALMGIEAIGQALRQSGISTAGAYLISGTTVGGMDSTEQHFQQMLEDNDWLHLMKTHDSGSTVQLMADYYGIPADRVVTISTACSSALNAIIVGANMIKCGHCDRVIAGGSEALSLFHLNGFNTLMILDTERCRPFDATRRGLNLGEGAGFVVLESEASLKRRGGQPLAQLSGYGNRCDAFHQTASSPEGEGARLAMEEALLMAGMKPTDIDYINAHGTGTPNNDASESAALQTLFADRLPAVSSTKSFTGHTTSASGSIETVICLIAMQRGFIPANLGWSHQMPDGITPSLGRSGIVLRHVMCNSFGFGGNESSIILSRLPESAEPEATDLPQTKVEVEIVAEVTATPDAPVTNIRDYIPALEARRLCMLQKSALVTSLSALSQAGIACPDAIIVGTAYGMLENSEKFLLQLCREGEHALSPTLFMQSTHNTIAGALAIKTHCKGYNITYTELSQERVLELCMRDAEMLMEQGKIKTALIGFHNEVTPLLHDMVMRLRGEDLPIGVTSVAKVVKAKNI